MSNAVLKGNASGTGTVTLETPNTNSDLTISMPAAAGTMMVSGAMPAFSAYANANTAVSNGTFTKIALGVEDFDTASCFASSRFTPNVAGYYQINWGVRAEAVLLVESAIYKNGALSCTGSAVGANSYVSTGSHLIYMNGTTDYVELYCAQYSGSTQNMTGNQNTRMSGFLARAA
jgi:hypothetical protein